jgi:hypothetical protein
VNYLQKCRLTGPDQVLKPLYRCRTFSLFAFLLFQLWNSCPLSAQDKKQQLRGTVVDKTSYQPLQFVNVTATGNSSAVAVTDSAGRYQFELEPGKYLLTALLPGYKPTVKENVVLYSARQQVEDVELERRVQQIDSVVIKPGDDSRSVGLDMWNVQNFAAVFYDPARVVNVHAGVINMDDGTNHLTVRGTSPNYVQWKLEQVEIVNPNHLENGGTQNDRPALNGGGVSMISAQLIQQSAFHFAPFQSMQGNALSGIFDMRLRTGNNQKAEHILQASLLGIDLCTEGPISKEKGSSYLVNFRYSTIGLLSKLGVNFGDENSTFGDLSHMLTFPYKRGIIKIFGINGQSGTTYGGKEDSSLVEIQKELQDITYSSRTFINGASVLTRLNNGTYLKNVVAYSDKSTARRAIPLYDGAWRMPYESDRLRQSKLSALSYLSGQIGPFFNLKAGAYFNYFSNEVSSENNNVAENTAVLQEPLFQPFLSADGQLTKRFGVSAALQGYYLPRLSYSLMQPHVELRYDLGSKQELTFSFGQSAQLQNHVLYLGDKRNINLLPTTNKAFSLSHVLKLGSTLIKSEAYYQLYSQVPNDTATGFSAFNYFNEMITFALQQDGKARVEGFDLRAEYNGRPFYMIASSSLYRSVYSNPGSAEKDARFSTGYNFFVCSGREQALKKSGRSWSIDARGTYRNGFLEKDWRTGSADLVYERRLPQYWRIDLRLSYKKNKPGQTSIWALDLQNVTGRKNEAYHYFDMVTGKEEIKYNLGLIPVLSYKLMF